MRVVYNRSLSSCLGIVPILFSNGEGVVLSTIVLEMILKYSVPLKVTSEKVCWNMVSHGQEHNLIVISLV